MSEKEIRAITAIDSKELERTLNKFFEEVHDLRWRLVCVTAGSGYRTAWLEWDPT